jgi:hypothetical protein
LHGIGRKIRWNTCSFGLIEEGQFENNKLIGFGRLMKSSGYCAIGQWKAFWTIHGYAKIIKDDGTTDEGYWENADWSDSKSKKKEDIKSYKTDTDPIAKVIEYEKYIRL